MHLLVEDLVRKFNEVGISNEIGRRGQVCSILAGLNTKKVRNLYAEFLINTDSEDVGIYVFDIASVMEEHRADVLEMLNYINANYRYVRFFVGENDSVCAACDVPKTAQDVPATAVELFVRLSQMVDECYPYIMRSMWGA